MTSEGLQILNFNRHTWTLISEGVLQRATPRGQPFIMVTGDTHTDLQWICQYLF